MRQSLEELRPSRLPPLREDVYKVLLKAIFSGQLNSGERLVEGSIAKKLGVSRTPVREAVRRLESEGLVQSVPGKGLKVINISDERIREIFAVREALECTAVTFTTERITGEEIRHLEQIVDEGLRLAHKDDATEFLASVKRFNRDFIETSKAQNLITMIYTYHEYVNCLRLRSLAGKDRRLQAAKEHAAILHAVKHGDSERAKELIHQHLKGSHEYYKKSEEFARNIDDGEASLVAGHEIG